MYFENKLINIDKYLLQQQHKFKNLMIQWRNILGHQDKILRHHHLQDHRHHRAHLVIVLIEINHHLIDQIHRIGNIFNSCSHCSNLRCSFRAPQASRNNNNQSTIRPQQPARPARYKLVFFFIILISIHFI